MSQTPRSFALSHGGNLDAAVARFGTPRAAWLDLSTGINPHAYPVPPLPADAWQRLPEPSAALALAAQAYYGAPQMLAVAGTQAAIQALPLLRMQGSGIARVVVSAPSYAEHAQRWTLAGHQVRPVLFADLAATLPQCDVMVLCNPNNPTGATVAPALLLQWAAQLAARGGWLIVDEAFGDSALQLTQLSVAGHSAQPGLIVLRSVGKFFGLAGLRLGFVAAAAPLLAALAQLLGPWSVSGPAQLIACAALGDRAWQHAMRQQLARDGARLQALLLQHAIVASGSALYQWWAWPPKQAEQFSVHMAQRAIWVRLFDDAASAMTGSVSGIRLGLPPDEEGWQRLQQALAAWTLGTIKAACV